MRTTEERIAWLQDELARRATRIDEIEQARADLQRLLDVMSAQLGQTQLLLEESRAWFEAERSRLEQGLQTWEQQAKAVEAHRDQLAGNLQALQRDWAQMESDRDQLSRDLQSARFDLQQAREAFHRREIELTAAIGQLESERERFANDLEAVRSGSDEASGTWQRRERELASTIVRLEGARADLETRLAVIEGSSSWKLTAPLRAARRLLSRQPRTATADLQMPAAPIDSPPTPPANPAAPEIDVSTPVEPAPAAADIDVRPSIVVVSHDAHFYGAQRVALFLARSLAQDMGYRVDILLCGQGPLVQEFADVGLVHDFHSEASTPEVRAGIIQDLYRRGARIALCNTSCVGDVVHALKTAGFTVLSLIHEMPGLISQYGLEDSIATIARDADKVVFGADVVRDRFVELTGLSKDKVVVRPQGLLTRNRYVGRRSEARQELRARLGLGEQVLIALAVGSAHRRKGPDLFVEAGLAVITEREDVVFVWVGHTDGDGFTDAIARVSAAGAEARFFFPGVIEDSDVFFAGADVYLMTSREDPFPSVVLHALDAELPVVGFDNAGGFVELLRRDCGVLVPYLDTSAMAAAVLQLLAHPAEGQRMSAVGKHIVSREFEFTDYVRDLVSLAQGPRVSVIVPNYNYAHHLAARLGSIVAQTYRPHEILFLDDCSSDTSVEVAEDILGRSRIPFRIIKNDRNLGVCRQWLRGIRDATGDLVWIAEADDDCSSLLLETLVPAFANPDVVLAYCQSRQIDDTGAQIAPDYLGWTADVHATKWRQPYVRRGVDEIRDSLVVKNTIPNASAVLMRKPDLTEIESDMLSLRNAGDWLVYVHALERGAIAYVPEPLNYHRRHSGSVTIGQGGLNLMRETLFVQRHVLDRYQIPSEVEVKREAHLQATYVYLGLDRDGPASYKDHEALRPLTVVAG